MLLAAGSIPGVVLGHACAEGRCCEPICFEQSPKQFNYSNITWVRKAELMVCQNERWEQMPRCRLRYDLSRGSYSADLAAQCAGSDIVVG